MRVYRPRTEAGRRLACLPRPHRVRLRVKVRHAILRCTRPAHPGYGNYGGRGICVCEQWLGDPVEFVLYLATLPGWDDPSLMLDREDNDGHYEPGNLRFVTRRESQANRRRAA